MSDFINWIIMLKEQKLEFNLFSLFFLWTSAPCSERWNVLSLSYMCCYAKHYETLLAVCSIICRFPVYVAWMLKTWAWNSLFFAPFWLGPLLWITGEKLGLNKTIILHDGETIEIPERKFVTCRINKRMLRIVIICYRATVHNRSMFESHPWST